jgi:hypothetical protein
MRDLSKMADVVSKAMVDAERIKEVIQTGLSACSRVQYFVCALFAQLQKRPWRISAPSSSRSL